MKHKIARLGQQLERAEAAAAPAEDFMKRFWRKAAEHAEQARRDWRPSMTLAEITELAAAIEAGRLVLDVRADHTPIWYDFRPSAPYPVGCWETPWYHAAKAAKRLLTSYQNTLLLEYDPADVRAEMPADAPAVVQWLRDCVVWYAAYTAAA